MDLKLILSCKSDKLYILLQLLVEVMLASQQSFLLVWQPIGVLLDKYESNKQLF